MCNAEGGNLCRDCGESMPETFFGKDGLRLAYLAETIMRFGELAIGADGITWQYEHGVWKPAKNIVRDRCTWMLKDKYRRSHATNVEDIVAAQVPRISNEPVSRYINFQNGLLDWELGVLEPHRPDVLSTTQLAVKWNPKAECPAFEKWLLDVVPHDCIPMVWELIGYLMYSGNPLQTAVMLIGGGANGKSTFLRLMHDLAGGTNVSNVSLKALADGSNRFAAATLYGKLLNIAGDIDGTYLKDTAQFKSITGGDVLQAEHKGRDHFQFTPWATPIFSANKVPAASDTSTGYMRRWLVVPFPNSFEGREDRSIEERLKGELPGIAVRGAEALRGLLKRGQWELSESALEAREKFKQESDPVQAWVAEETDRADEFTSRSVLWNSYKLWCGSGNGNSLSNRELYKRLKTMGFTEMIRGGDRGFRGLVMKDARPGWAEAVKLKAV